MMRNPYQTGLPPAVNLFFLLIFRSNQVSMKSADTFAVVLHRYSYDRQTHRIA